MSKVGQIGTFSFRLADWLAPEDRYQRRYVPVEPADKFVQGQQFRFEANDQIRLWYVNSWAKGEGDVFWRAGGDKFAQSAGVRPVPIGDGIQLGPLVDRGQLESAGGNNNEALRMGIGAAKLWALFEDGDTPRFYDVTNNEWDTISGSPALAGGGTSDARTIASPDDGTTKVYSAHTNNKIYEWDTTGATSTQYNTGTGDDFTDDPVLVAFREKLFALDGHDLYEIDLSTTNTRTLRSDLGSISPFDDRPQRVWISDVGPIWYVRLRGGETLIYQYNVADDTTAVIGKLPVAFAQPYDITFVQGFVVVAYRYASEHAENGPAYLYLFRGAQQASVGPFRNPSASGASKAITPAGMIGDDLIVFFDDNLWAYTLSEGGLSNLGASLDAQGTTQAIDSEVFGRSVFVAGLNGTSPRVNRWDFTQYRSSGTLNTGRYDFAYPGINKLFLNVTVQTDPLPANTTVTMAYRVDGATSFTSLSGTHQVDGATSYTWTFPTGGSSVVGKDIEFQIGLTTTTSTSTPIVRAMSANATSAEHRVEFIMQVDAGSLISEGGPQETIAPHVALANLKTLASGRQIETFTDPFQVRDQDSAETFTVTVEEVITPQEWESADPLVATLRLVTTDTV